MRIQTFAVLKDYFDKEFELSNDAQNISTLKQQLSAKNPKAANVLNLCRFAVNDEFIDDDYQFNRNDTISIIPPSSGG